MVDDHALQPAIVTTKTACLVNKFNNWTSIDNENNVYLNVKIRLKDYTLFYPKHKTEETTFLHFNVLEMSLL